MRCGNARFGRPRGQYAGGPWPTMSIAKRSMTNQDHNQEDSDQEVHDQEDRHQEVHDQAGP